MKGLLGIQNDYNHTNSQIEEYHKMEKMALEMKIRLEESLKREADAKEREKEASERKDDILKRELEAQKAAEGPFPT